MIKEIYTYVQEEYSCIYNNTIYICDFFFCNVE